MTRGKYATRAANVRAETAQEAVAELRRQLSEERAARAVETAALKTQVQQLSGKLTSSVGALAQDAIASARQGALDAIRGEREAHKERAFAALRIIGSYVKTLPARGWPQLYDALGVTADEVAAAEAGGLEPNQNRKIRRTSQKEFRAKGNDMASVLGKEVVGDLISQRLTARED